MPKRQNKRRVACDAVQGEGSYVVLRKLPWRTIEERMTAGDLSPEESLAMSHRVIVEAVTEWNWVDDDGAALPLPAADPAVIGELSEDEIEFLSNLISGRAAEKNSSGGWPTT